ncbi:MAG TPA: 50S ribosomal protein L31 [Anaerolineae bacterium]|nr:50S ribosomal protein L31 [Anaerolineae bacterium]HCC79067.1 50S ribosomal protein L31 [Anaerolineae bacterium]HCM97399.1 50S ribosomal protein L31 [Anaerolineae bacterium]
MKEGIHPTYFPDATVTCACGNTWTTGSTKKEIRIEICSQCHPFFSGELQRIVDIEGQVDRFYKKLQARQDYVEETKTRKESRISPKRPISELELGKRATDALAAANISMVGQFIEKLAEGEDSVLAISGFGRKSLIDFKKKLRSLGYDIPEPEVA